MNTNEILKSFDKILTVVISSYLILLLLFGIILFFSSCEKDVHTREIEVKYDSEDNIVKMEGQWVQSINLDTWEPANDSFGIWHNSNFLFIKSNKYKILDVKVLSLATYTTITDNTAHVYIPNMENYMNDLDVFNLIIEVR